MRPMEITIGISPADLAPWNGAEVPVRFIISEKSVRVCFPQIPPLASEVLKQLRADYAEIESSLSPQSRELLFFLLHTTDGRTTRQELIDHIWPVKVPTWSGVRKAVHTLNTSLIRLGFGCVVQGSRNGVFRLCPIAR